MLVKGDKIKLVKVMGMFDNIGEICEVVDVNDKFISFVFGNGMHMGCMSHDEVDKYFEKYEEPKKPVSVSPEYVDNMLKDAVCATGTVFNKCTVVSCKLPNGFVIVESSSCIDPNNYDKELGIDICMKRIRDRIFEMEAYKMHFDMNNECHTCHCDCEDCSSCDEDEDEDPDYCEGCKIECNTYDNCEDCACPYQNKQN